MPLLAMLPDFWQLTIKHKGPEEFPNHSGLHGVRLHPDLTRHLGKIEELDDSGDQLQIERAHHKMTAEQWLALLPAAMAETGAS
jgi:hypothetical protein